MGNRFERIELAGYVAVYRILDDDLGFVGYISVHRLGKDNGVAFGATRMWHYDTEEEVLNDSLRLAQLMSRKSALARLSYGGAKGVISVPQGTSPQKRRKLLEAYTNAVNELNGSFVTGADVGVFEDDLSQMKSIADSIVGFNYDPVKFTAIGLYQSVAMVLEHIYGNPSFEGRSFAIQGLGKVGGEFLRLIHDSAAVIYGADIDEERLAEMAVRYPKLQVVSSDKIHEQAVDVFVPCALSGVLDPVSVKALNCKAIVGAANNQLSSSEVADLIHDRGIVYAPDYVVNAGGLISVVDEYENENVDDQRVADRVANIAEFLKDILDNSRGNGHSTGAGADAVAEEYIKKHMTL